MPQSPVLLYEHIVQGQGQKEVFSNEADDTLERKLTTEATINVGGTGDYNFSNDEVRDLRIELTGLLTGDRNLQVPARNMLYQFVNNTTGAFVLTLQVVGGAGVTVDISRGFTYWFWCDGVDILDVSRELFDYVTNVATTYQALESDRKVNGDTLGGAFTITLPQAAPGKQVLISSIGAATALTIARGGSDTMNGSASNITIATQWQAVLFTGENATNWIAHRLTVA